VNRPRCRDLRHRDPASTAATRMVFPCRPTHQTTVTGTCGRVPLSRTRWADTNVPRPTVGILRTGIGLGDVGHTITKQGCPVRRDLARSFDSWVRPRADLVLTRHDGSNPRQGARHTQSNRSDSSDSFMGGVNLHPDPDRRFDVRCWPGTPSLRPVDSPAPRAAFVPAAVRS
jgi:hypothetical protein